GLVDLTDRLADEDRRVEGDRVGHALGEIARQVIHPSLNPFGDIERVGAGRQENGHARRLLLVEIEELAVGLGTELDPADVAYTRHVAVGAGLDDHGAELIRIVEATGYFDRVLERLVVGRRRRADLARGDLLALLLQRLDDILRRETACLHLVGI